MYMEAAHDKIVGPDRPIMYGLYMQLSSLGISLWGVIWIQAFILSLVLFYYFKYCCIGEKKNKITLYASYLAFSFVAAFLMGAGFTASW